MAERKWDQIMAELVAGGTIPDPLNRVLLFGPPRTGKSSIAKTLFKRHERVTIHKQLPVEDLLGSYALVNGTTVWQDGPAIRALREGLPIVLDEIDQISSECRCILHALLDDPPGITLASGERVEGTKGYCVIGTTNQLPSALPPAVLDRFDLILTADSLSDGLKKSLGNLAHNADAVVQRGGQYNWTRPASVNLFIAASKLRRKGLDDSAIARSLGFEGQRARDLVISLARKG